IDLDNRTVIDRIVGLSGPQGIGHGGGSDMVYVANGGDGMVRLFAAADLAPVARLALGRDADNIRVDPGRREIIVGYGDGGLAVIDGTTGLQTAAIPLPVHPEGFQLGPGGRRIFVNLTDRNEIAVVDRGTRQITARWTVPGLRANFAMAIDDSGAHILVAFRHPARLAILDAADGKPAAILDSCEDADDVFYDGRRGRAYVSCGDGAIDVIEQDGDGYAELARVPTAPGARTSLFVPELDRLYVAARAGATQPAAILVFKPQP
ncbi:MAG: YncE family protein, partial [Roseiarcus sp.]